MKTYLALLLPLAAISSGQDYRGKIQGFVTDSSQAVIVGAKVSLSNDRTGIVTVKETNASGRYFFDYVEPGSYTIAVEQAGFAKFVQQNVVLQVAGDVTVNAALVVGPVTETVVVRETPA